MNPIVQIPCENGNWLQCRRFNGRNRRYQRRYGADVFCNARNWVKCNDGREGYIKDDVQIKEVVLTTIEENGPTVETTEESYLPEAFYG